MVNNETGREILKEFVDGWSERNPNLELIGAYYHADEEGVPHVHCDYVPVAHGYKRGMETQTGLVKALGEMGFEKKGKATAQIQWQARENKHLEELCLERGIDVLHPERDAKQHLDTREYKQRQRIDMMDEQLDKMAMEVVTATKQCEEEELRLKKTSRKTARLLKKLDELQSDGEPVTLKLNMIGERTFKPLGSLISEIKEQEAYKSALMKEIDEYERNTTLHKQMQAEVLQNSLEYLRKRYDAKMSYLRKNVKIPYEDTREWDNTDWECWCEKQKYGSLENAIKAIDEEIRQANNDMLEQVEELEQVSDFARQVYDAEPELSCTIKKRPLKNDTIIENVSPEQVQEVFELAANFQEYLAQQNRELELERQELKKKEMLLQKRENGIEEEKFCARKQGYEKGVVEYADKLEKANKALTKAQNKIDAYNDIKNKCPKEYEALNKAYVSKVREEMEREFMPGGRKQRQKSKDEHEFGR